MSSVAALWDEMNGEVDDFFIDDGAGSGLYGGSAPGGVPFLSGTLTNAFIIVEAAFGADINSAEPQTWNWFDITADVRQADGGNISITIGRSDETSQAPPASCTFQLDNTSSTYTAYHPFGVWYPFVRRNTPIRVRLFVNGVSHTRFQGYANGWVPSWDESANLAIVTVSASGVFRRLQQGKTPLRSAMYRAITQTSPSAYWPLEDGKDSTQALASDPSVRPLQIAGSKEPAWAAVDGPPGSGSVVDFSKGGHLYAPLPAVTRPSSLRIEFSFKTTTVGMIMINWIMQGGALVHGQAAINSIAPNAGFLKIGIFDASSVGDYNTVGSAIVDNGVWHHVRIQYTVSGSDTFEQVWLDGVSVYTVTVAGKLFGPINGMEIGFGNDEAPTDFQISHVAVWMPWPASSAVDTYEAFTGYTGEDAVTRMVRLCGENSLALTVARFSDIAMGPQGVDTFSNIVRECETTDDGLLFDGLGPGLSYINRQIRYNAIAQLTPDMSADPPQIANPFVPTDDDQRNRNVMKVDRKNGSTQTFEDSTDDLGTGEIGTYDSSLTVNTETDDVLLSRASWEVHKGTARGFRYPTLSFDLAATPAVIPAWLAIQLSARIDVLNVTNRATQHPPGTVSLLLEGYSETLTPFDWSITANCSPYDPWNVFTISDSNFGRLQTDGSTLAADAVVGATTLSVASTGPVWTTLAADLPLSVEISGIQVTVTNITGSSSPQTFTVTGVTKTLHNGDAVTIWKSGAIAL